MKLITCAIAISTALLSGAIAQTAAPANPNGGTPAVATPNTTNPAAPVPGANSFTEAQAKARIEEQGYTDVSELAKDKDGIWRGKAKKAGAMVSVALDFQGNVVAK